VVDTSILADARKSTSLPSVNMLKRCSLGGATSARHYRWRWADRNHATPSTDAASVICRRRGNTEYTAPRPRRRSTTRASHHRAHGTGA
jgi:hypothetical protein